MASEPAGSRALSLSLQVGVKTSQQGEAERMKREKKTERGRERVKRETERGIRKQRHCKRSVGFALFCFSFSVCVSEEAKKNEICLAAEDVSDQRDRHTPPMPLHGSQMLVTAPAHPQTARDGLMGPEVSHNNIDIS